MDETVAVHHFDAIGMLNAHAWRSGTVALSCPRGGAGPATARGRGRDATMPRSLSLQESCMASSLDPLDLYDVRALLSDEERMAQD
ncbi:MAG: hypothetical protein ACREP0_07555, partial [Rhodanobacteraceae bacterium]